MKLQIYSRHQFHVKAVLMSPGYWRSEFRRHHYRVSEISKIFSCLGHLQDQLCQYPRVVVKSEKDGLIHSVLWTPLISRYEWFQYNRSTLQKKCPRWVQIVGGYSLPLSAFGFLNATDKSGSHHLVLSSGK